MAEALDLELAGEDCARCDTPMVITYDALRRPRKRCPKCDGVSRRAPPNADTVLVPVILGTALPPIELGQLRCQGCGRGIDRRERFCASCRAKAAATPRGTNQQRTYTPKPCFEPSCRKMFTPTGPRSLYCPECQ